jgi:hypothetical protein
LLAALGTTEALVQQDGSKYYEPAFLHWGPAVG